MYFWGHTYFIFSYFLYPCVDIYVFGRWDLNGDFCQWKLFIWICVQVSIWYNSFSSCPVGSCLTIFLELLSVSWIVDWIQRGNLIAWHVTTPPTHTPKQLSLWSHGNDTNAMIRWRICPVLCTVPSTCTVWALMDRLESWLELLKCLSSEATTNDAAQVVWAEERREGAQVWRSSVPVFSILSTEHLCCSLASSPVVHTYMEHS